MKRISGRLKQILKKNAEFEKETPYNFCDRWCERCAHEKQIRCKIYQDEFEQKITCIAHGREPDDPEITAEVMKKQHAELEEIFEEYEEELDIDFNEADDPEFEKIKEHIKFVENNPLQKTAEQYYREAHVLLEESFHKKYSAKPGLNYHFKTVVWHHALLPAKINRALAGFHEAFCDGDLALYDAVAQFEICKKAINETVEALREIDKSITHAPVPYHDGYGTVRGSAPRNPETEGAAGVNPWGSTYHHKQISLLLALLHNIYDRIDAMENSI